MPEDNIRFDHDEDGRLVPVSAPVTSPAPGLAPTPPGLAETQPMSRGRKLAVAGVAVTIVALTGGAVAMAESSGAATPTARPGYGGPGGYGLGGYGPGGYGMGSAGAPNGSTTPAARTPHLAGTVKSVSGTAIKITDFEGFTRTINTSSKTKYSDSLTASPAVGTKIVAGGTVNADGVSLDATTIAKDTHTGPGGFFGPGRGHGPGGTRPTGVPSSAPSAAQTA